MNINLSQRLYVFSLRAYPRTFRAKYSAELARVFDEGLRDAQAEGFRRTVRFYCHTSADLLTSSTREHLSVLELKTCLVAFVAVGFGCFATIVDFRTTEVQATLLVILASSFAIGYIAPKRAWRPALLIAGCLPTIHILAFALKGIESTQTHPYFSRLMTLLPAFIAALLGAYSGAFGRFICRSFSHFLQKCGDRSHPPSA